MPKDLDDLSIERDSTSNVLNDLKHFILPLVKRGGPVPQEYASISRMMRSVGDSVRSGLLPITLLRPYLTDLTKQYFMGTMQADAILKPHGYSGDFEIIDNIYQMRIANDPNLVRWDLYFHAQAAPVAVRNRKSYFHRLLNRIVKVNPDKEIRVLNIASGPARDLREWFDAHPTAKVSVDCIELDPKAIDFAQRLTKPHAHKLHFHLQNALKFTPTEPYDLIWSAGLFDYLTDRLFVRLIRALLPFVKPGGQLVVGNFSNFNPSRDYMELLGDWYLEHRSETELAALMQRAGAKPESISVRWEPEGVNLFAHIKG